MFKDLKGKRLLVLGATIDICDIVRYAQKMGVYVIVADYYLDSPAKSIADESALFDASDVEAIVDYCNNNHIDGITTGFVDVLLMPCYQACKRLNLPFYANVKMIEMATNKTVFKETCEKYGVPVPKTHFIGSKLDNDLLNKIVYPVFVKPLDASGSRGAGVCYNDDELKTQFDDAKSFSPTDNVIIEDYITGREFLLDYIAVDGEYRLLESFDRYVCDDRGSAINFANFSIAPTKYLEKYYDEVNEKVINMFKQEGFEDGLLFLQGHCDGNRITFYEMGCRLGGSFYNLEKKILGYNAVEMIVNYALCGKMLNDINSIGVDVAKFDKLAVSYNFLLKPDDEIVCKIIGYEKIKSIENVVSAKLSVREGISYYNKRVIDKPALTVHLVGDSLEEITQIINSMNETFDVLNSNGKSMLMKKFNPEWIDY